MQTNDAMIQNCIYVVALLAVPIDPKICQNDPQYYLLVWPSKNSLVLNGLQYSWIRMCHSLKGLNTFWTLKFPNSCCLSEVFCLLLFFAVVGIFIIFVVDVVSKQLLSIRNILWWARMVFAGQATLLSSPCPLMFFVVVIFVVVDFSKQLMLSIWNILWWAREVFGG